MPAPHRLAAGIGLLLLGSVTGCYLFQPRNPQPPTQGGVPVDYSSTEASLTTMKLAIEAKGASNSLTAYHDAFADSVVSGDRQSFLAFFDPTVVAVWQSATSGTPPSIWTLKQEGQVLSYVTGLSGNDYVFSWLTDVDHPHDETPDPNTQVLHRQYVLEAQAPVQGGVKVDTLAIGYADLTFILGANAKWVISRWQDRVDPAVGPNPPQGDKLSFTRMRLNTGAQP